ncbi:unnamed protein product [Caretta caretta]
MEVLSEMATGDFDTVNQLSGQFNEPEPIKDRRGEEMYVGKRESFVTGSLSHHFDPHLRLFFDDNFELHLYLN